MGVVGIPDQHFNVYVVTGVTFVPIFVDVPDGEPVRVFGVDFARLDLGGKDIKGLRIEAGLTDLLSLIGGEGVELELFAFEPPPLIAVGNR